MTPHDSEAFHKDNIDRITETFYDAFEDDPFLLWMMGGPQEYRKIGAPLIRTWVRYTTLYGYGLRVQNFSAAVMFRKPGDIKMGFSRLFRSGMLKTQSLLGKEGMRRLMTAEKQVEAKRKAITGDQRFLYCWMLGTAPADQGKGCGTALMEKGFEQYPAVSCYLETQKERNRQYYEGMGFEERGRIHIEGTDFPIICMLKETRERVHLQPILGRG